MAIEPALRQQTNWKLNRPFRRKLNGQTLRIREPGWQAAGINHGFDKFSQIFQGKTPESQSEIGGSETDWASAVRVANPDFVPRSHGHLKDPVKPHAISDFHNNLAFSGNKGRTGPS